MIQFLLAKGLLVEVSDKWKETCFFLTVVNSKLRKKLLKIQTLHKFQYFFSIGTPRSNNSFNWFQLYVGFLVQVWRETKFEKITAIERNYNSISFYTKHSSFSFWVYYCHKHEVTFAGIGKDAPFDLFTTLLDASLVAEKRVNKLAKKKIGLFYKSSNRRVEPRVQNMTRVTFTKEHVKKSRLPQSLRRRQSKRQPLISSANTSIKIWIERKSCIERYAYNADIIQILKKCLKDKSTNSKDLAYSLVNNKFPKNNVQFTKPRNQKYDVFMSHAWEDAYKPKIRLIATFLRCHGISVWFDENEMGEGEIDNLMKTGVQISKIFLAMFTNLYATKVLSNYVEDNCRKEWYFAKNDKKPIFSVVLENIGEKSKAISASIYQPLNHETFLADLHVLKAVIEKKLK